LLIIAAGVVAFLPSFLCSRNFLADAFYYLTLAKGLPFKYSLPSYAHFKYLPAFPALILLSHLLTGRLIDFMNAAKLVSMLSLIATSVLVFDFVYYRLRSFPSALGAGIIAILSPAFLLFSGNILSELPFTFFASAAFVFMLRKKPYLPWIFAALAILTRYEGIFLIPALIIGQWRAPKKLALGALIMIIICGPWVFFILSNFGKFFAFSYPTEAIIAQGHAGFLFLWDMVRCLSPMIVVLGMAGILLLPRALRPGMVLFISGYIILHMYWHWRDARFIVPMVPFFALGAAFAVDRLFQTYLPPGKSSGKIALAGILALTAVSLALFDGFAFRELAGLRRDPRKAVMQKILQYDPSAVVLTNIEPVVCEWYGVKNVHRWSDLKRTDDAYAWAAERYAKDGARYLVWRKTDNFAILFFKELGQKGLLTKTVQLQGQARAIAFYPILFEDSGKMIVFSIEMNPAPKP